MGEFNRRGFFKRTFGTAIVTLLPFKWERPEIKQNAALKGHNLIKETTTQLPSKNCPWRLFIDGVEYTDRCESIELSRDVDLSKDYTTEFTLEPTRVRYKLDTRMLGENSDLIFENRFHHFVLQHEDASYGFRARVSGSRMQAKKDCEGVIQDLEFIVDGEVTLVAI